MSFQSEVLHFFETISKYYDSKTEISFRITDNLETNDTKLDTWSLSEFELQRSAYRTEGNKFMMEGPKTYHEISANHLISYTQKGRNKFEFIEQFGENAFRITKIRFHYKY